MEDNSKRVILAVALSLVVVIGWQFLFPTPKPAPQPAQQTSGAQATAPAATPVAPSDLTTTKEFFPTQGKDITVTTPLFHAVLNTQGGVLTRFELLKYKETIEPGSPNIDLVGEHGAAKAPLGLILNLNGAEVHTWTKGQWAYEGGDVNLAPGQSATLVFTGEVAGMHLVRQLTVHADTYLIDEEVSVLNTGAAPLDGSVAFTAAAKSMTPADNRYDPTKLAYYGSDSGFQEMSSRKDLEKDGLDYTGAMDWCSIESNYFIFAVLPRAAESAFAGKVQDDVFRMAAVQSATFTPGAARTLKTSYFIGPCERQLLAQVPGNLDKAVNFGWTTFLAKPLLVALNFFYGYVGNYGVAIILLTIVMKLCFWPLSQKSYKSMNQMKKLQPMLQKIREKYGDDKQKIQQESMQLYKTYKINPAAGCLPMVLQIPVFFGLYKALLGAIELRHAPFIEFLPFTHTIWLADLSAKDPFYITPIVMGVTTFLSQLMTPTSGDPTQKKIMMIIPLVFTFMFLNFPSGLVVYWLMNNVLSIAQQWFTMRGASKA